MLLTHSYFVLCEKPNHGSFANSHWKQVEFCHRLQVELEQLSSYFEVQQTVTFFLGSIKYWTWDIKIQVWPWKSTQSFYFYCPSQFNAHSPPVSCTTLIEQQWKRNWKNHRNWNISKWPNVQHGFAASLIPLPVKFKTSFIFKESSSRSLLSIIKLKQFAILYG